MDTEIRNITEVYTVEPTEWKQSYNVSETGGVWFSDGVTSIPVTGEGQLYVTVDIGGDVPQKPRTIFAGITIGGDEIQSNLNLVPVKNTGAMGRTFCVVLDALRSWLANNWWGKTTTKGDAEVSDFEESDNMVITMSCNIDYYTAMDSSSVNVGFVMHKPETSNDFYICDSLTDSDQYIYAALDSDFGNVAVEFEKIG